MANIKILASKSVYVGPLVANENEECLYARFHFFMTDQMSYTPKLNRFRVMLTQFGVLPHESALLLHINDAFYDFTFLSKLFQDLPEMHNPVPTLNRYKESMKWITRTVDALRNHGLTSHLRDEQCHRLEIMCHLICAEMAARDGFELGYDREAAEFSKTSAPAVLTVPKCLDKVKYFL